MAHLNLICGWTLMLAGALSGAVLGACFRREDFLGGYGSFPRRLVRLGHIACFGLGFVNVLFALSVGLSPPAPGTSPSLAAVASWSLAVGAVTMPACCGLCAFRPRLVPLFVVPVAAVVTGIVALLGSWT